MTRVILSLMMLLSLVSCAAESRLSAAVALGLLGDDGGDKLFYYPTKDSNYTPKHHRYAYQDVYFQSADGLKLHGWWMPANGAAKATVVYSHGNAGSMGHHLVFVDWLIDAGYNVLMYDYRGYGLSEGEVSKEGLVLDAGAAFSYVASRDGVDDIVAVGHSMGGAKSIAALSLAAPELLKAVIVDSTFSSYRDMAERVAGKAARKVVSDTYNPCDRVGDLPKGVPLMVVHGAADSTIPFSQAEKLYAAANHPKTLMEIAGGNHVNCFFIKEGKYRRELLQWMDQVLQD